MEDEGTPIGLVMDDVLHALSFACPEDVRRIVAVLEVMHRNKTLWYVLEAYGASREQGD